jgi:hypothetical protein
LIRTVRGQGYVVPAEVDLMLAAVSVSHALAVSPAATVPVLEVH